MTHELTRRALLALALAEHNTLSAALAAAQLAWSWAAGDDAEPPPATEDLRIAALQGKLQASARGAEPSVPAAAPIGASPGPAPAEISKAEESGDTLTDPSEAQVAEPTAPAEDPPAPEDPPPLEPPPTAATPPPARDVLDETIDAVREIVAATGATNVTVEEIADALRMEKGVVAKRVQRLVAGRRLIQVGAGAKARYRLVTKPAAPALEPATPPPAPIRAEESPFVSIETVKRFLQTKDFVITGGPETYKVDGHDRHFGWLVDRANRFREADGKILWILRG